MDVRCPRPAPVRGRLLDPRDRDLLLFRDVQVVDARRLVPALALVRGPHVVTAAAEATDATAIVHAPVKWYRCRPLAGRCQDLGSEKKMPAA